MTEVTKVVKLTTVIESAPAEAGAKKVRAATDKIGKGAKLATGALSSLTSSLKTLVPIATLAGAAVVVTKTIGTFTEFSSTISNLSAITGATGKDLNFLEKASRDMGATTSFSAIQAANAFKIIASAKPDLLESVEALRLVTQEALLLAEAAGTTIPEAGKALTSALNQFGADASEASRFVNVLAAGSKFGASEINETAMALKAAGTAAAAVKIPFEETNAAIQLLGNVSIKGAEAGTALRNILLRMSTQADTTINPSIVGMSQAFLNLKEKQLPLIELQKLFSLEAFAAGKSLLNQADSIAVLTDKLTGTKVASEQARVNLDNLGGDLKTLGSAATEFGLKLVSANELMLRSITQSATEAFKELPDFMDRMGKISDAIYYTFFANRERKAAIIPKNTMSELDALESKILGVSISLKSMLGREEKTPVVLAQIENLQGMLTNMKKDAWDVRESLFEASEFKTQEKEVEKVDPQALKDYEAQFFNKEQILTESFIRRNEMINSFRSNGEIDAIRQSELEIQNEEYVLSEFEKINIKKLQIKEDANKALNGVFESDEERLGQAYRNRNLIIDNALNADIINEEKALKLRLKLNDKFFKDVDNLSKKGKREKLLDSLTEAQGIAGNLAYVTSVVADESKQAFEINKAFQYAAAIINTAVAVTKVIDNPWLAASVALAGLAQVYKISQTEPASATPSTPSSHGGGDQQQQQQPENLGSPPLTAGEVQRQTNINFYINGYTNSEIVKGEIIPMLKEQLDNGDTLFNEDSAQIEIIKRATA